MKNKPVENSIIQPFARSMPYGTPKRISKKKFNLKDYTKKKKG